MKREDGMQGSRSEAVDERGRSLVMDSGVGVSAPTWWRMMAVDGVAEEHRRWGPVVRPAAHAVVCWGRRRGEEEGKKG